MLEKPQPPGTQDMSEVDELESLRAEIDRLREDVAFLRQLLEHVRAEFSRLKGGER